MDSVFHTLYLNASCDPGLLCTLASNKDAFAAIASLVTSAAFIIAILTFISGLMQYRSTQRWKRAEFLTSEMKNFREDQFVKDVLGMMDYWGKIFEAGPQDDKKTIAVIHSRVEVKTDADYIIDIGTALHFHEDGPIRFEEEAVRDRFDVVLTYLERFEQYIETGLCNKKDFRSHVGYHVNLLNGMKPSSQGYHKVLMSYIVLYDLQLAEKFLSRFPQSRDVKEGLREGKKRKRQIESRSDNKHK